jgi:serine/threonine protein kinase
MDKELEDDPYINKFIDETYLIVSRTRNSQRLYVAVDRSDGEKRFVGVRLEETQGGGTLEQESRNLQRLQGIPHFPLLLWTGMETIDNRDCAVLVTELVGPSLNDFFGHCHKEFKLSTTVLVALKMLDCIQALHSKNLLHKDLSPESFCFGLGERSNDLILASLAHCSLYRDPFSKNHISYNEDKIVTHFNLYTSLNVLSGIGSLQ